MMTKREKTILFFLLTFILLLRLYHINVGPVEIEESWRQADTASIARNFAGYDFHPFHPNLNYDGPFPNIPALEIQVTTYLIAILYKVFGYHYFLARAVPIAFFLISALYLYLLARLYLGRNGAAYSLLIYGILPINLYYSRAIMPESAALMFWIGGFYYFNRWIINQNDHDYSDLQSKYGLLILSSFFLAFAIMTKPPVILIGIPMMYLCFKYYGRKWLKMRIFWIYGFITTAIPACYYYFSTAAAEYKFTLGITRNIIFKQVITAFYSPEALDFFVVNLPKALGISGLLLCLAGIFFLREKQKVFLLWFITMIFEAILIVSEIRAFYYLIFLMVPCCLLAGNLLARAVSGSVGKIAGVVLVLLLMKESYDLVKPMFTINTVMAKQVNVVKQLTDQNDLLVVGSLDPCLLDLTDRRGWRYNLRLYAATPKDPIQELDDYIARGAKYFVPIQGKIYGDQDEKLMSYIEGKYQKLEVVQGYPIYVLK
ncbi:dolichyl-phosphate-mannose--protein mannosyltransferase [Dehalobacter sp. MCB1]|nr:dolichyl-phosphate-mannose--protein mannosyltransferase [Dehalobacter sp. MCB1]TCX53924.1 dolichyl-phosphate-mannose--protein mannosyltransferase [Dehalobacter sp. 14DCB1]TCX55120.1 dolichyl-phosphate-mannose--protein mannosyltransferase [Dehalobacter sp. 12DCB1]